MFRHYFGADLIIQGHSMRGSRDKWRAKRYKRRDNKGQMIHKEGEGKGKRGKSRKKKAKEHNFI